MQGKGFYPCLFVFARMYLWRTSFCSVSSPYLRLLKEYNNEIGKPKQFKVNKPFDAFFSRLLFSIFIMEVRSITFDFKARYFLIGKPSPTTKYVWLICHGYGQLAEYFARNFNLLDDGQHVVIAPEGLSHFYLQGFSGRVGASWMTKEDRETDIRNYCHYLEEVVKSVFDIVGEHVSFTVFGFSQGAVTASRWVATTGVPIDRMILWGGGLPKDLNFSSFKKALAKSKCYMVYGRNDSFINETALEEQALLFRTAGLTYETVMFDGGHEIDIDVLKRFTP